MDSAEWALPGGYSSAGQDSTLSELSLERQGCRDLFSRHSESFSKCNDIFHKFTAAWTWRWSCLIIIADDPHKNDRLQKIRRIGARSSRLDFRERRRIHQCTIPPRLLLMRTEKYRPVRLCAAFRVALCPTFGTLNSCQHHLFTLYASSSSGVGCSRISGVRVDHTESFHRLIEGHHDGRMTSESPTVGLAYPGLLLY